MSLKTNVAAVSVTILSVATAIAGDVAVYSVDVREGPHRPYTGEVSEIARGDMPHVPLLVIDRADPYVIDACGNVYGYREDRYGEKALGEAFFSSDVFPKLVGIAETGTWGMDGDGKFHAFKLGGYESSQPSSLFGFDDEPLPEAEVFIDSDGSVPMFIDNKGRLVELDTSTTSISELRLVSGATGLGDVVHGIRTTNITNDGKAHRLVFLVKSDGSALVLDIVDVDNKLQLSGKPERYPGDYSDTVKLFGWNAANESIFRLTDQGDLMRLNVREASEEKIRLPATAHGRAAVKSDGTIYFASATGSFAECAAPVVEVVAEPEKFDDKGVLLYLERTEALYDRLLPFFDKIEEANNGMSTLQNDQVIDYFQPYADAIRDFRAKDEGQVLANFEQLERDYGGESGLYNFLVEATDGERRGFSWKINELINRYEKYRDETIPGIAQSLSNRAATAIQIAEFKGEDRTDEKMALYESGLKAASWAHFFDPELPGPDELKAQMADLKAAAAKAELKALEDNVWPGRYDRYTGGNADATESAALKYMQTRYPDAVLKVAIAGDWYVYKENVYGEPTSYCIPLHVGIRNQKDATRGYVNTGSICTQGNRPEPPFSHYAWLSDSEIIRIERLQ